MPCDLTTTQTAACASGVAELDNQVELLKVWAQSMATWVERTSPGTEVTAEAIRSRACTSGIGKMENQVQLLQVTAQNLCNLIT